MIDSSYNAETKIWSGPEKPPIYNTNVSLGYLILNVFKNTPDRITQVFVDTDSEMTCREMRARSIKIIYHLIDVGMKQGDVVGIIASNSENLAPVVFACFTLGLPINSLAPMLVEAVITHMFSKTKPKMIFCDATIIATVENAVNLIDIDPEIYTFMEKVDGYKFVNNLLKVECNVDDFVFPKLIDASNSTAIILCSSGTTGLNKGVCKSHSQIIAQICPDNSLTSPKQQVLFSPSPLHWLSGLIFLIGGTLYGGKRVITTKPFNADSFVELCNRYKITSTGTVPMFLMSLLKSESIKPIESIEILGVGGTAMPKGLCQSAARLFPNGYISTVYGMSEVDLVAVSSHFQRDGSSGKVSPNIHMKIIDEAGNNLGPNEQGEICMKTPVIFSGYFGEPERTAEAINDGWVYSGDIGYFDDDGFLFIVDRKKDILKAYGYDVYPSELEGIINEIDGVISSCVVGIFDESNGQDLIFGYVVKDPRNDKLTEVSILDYIHNKVIDAKKLRGGVHFIDALPMVNGKVKKYLVREMARKLCPKN